MENKKYLRKSVKTKIILPDKAVANKIVSIFRQIS